MAQNTNQPIKLPPRLPITLRDLRVQVYHESQRVFAERLGVTLAAVQSWERTGENAKTPRATTRWQIVEALGLGYDDIIWPEGKGSAAKAA